MARAASILGICALATVSGAAIAPLGAQSANVVAADSMHPADSTRLVAMTVRARLRNVLGARVMKAGSLDSTPETHDREILSPKSVRFSFDGTKVYVNALEGGKTLVYAWPSLHKLPTIVHRFGPADSALFRGDSTVFDYPYFTQSPDGSANVFTGRPVESELSTDGRWLFVPYYRRSFDASAQSPSALAVIDTRVDSIVRVLPTGPIPKYVAASPNGRLLAVTHWGDNTVALLDVSSGDPAKFHYVRHMVVERVLDQTPLAGTDRDRTCGFCLRGTVFTRNGRTLLVARMGKKGGVAGFDVASGRYLGTVMAVPRTPRHLELSADGRTLFASSGDAGVVSHVSAARVVTALRGARGKRVRGPRWRSVPVGGGARTIALDPSGTVLLAALNWRSEIVAVDATRLTVLARVRVAPYAVGLAIAPDGSGAVVTSQGHIAAKGSPARKRGLRLGGNSVDVLRLTWSGGEPAKSKETGSTAP
jgi:DNA-binding beta-propeller fold protein YncE